MLRSIFWDGGVKQKDVSYEEAVALANSGSGLLWLDVQPSADVPLKRVAKDFGIHASALGDWTAKLHRARVKEVDGRLIVVLTGMETGHNGHDADPIDVLTIVSERFLITVHNRDHKPIKALYDMVCDTGSAMSRGPGHLLYYIADQVVDSYFPALDAIDNQVANIEGRIFGDSRDRVLNHLFSIKRQCLQMRRVLAPMREVLASLSRFDMALIQREDRPYFMLAYDHVLRLLDTAENYRDLLTSALDVYLSAQSNRLNEVMKTLTIIATIMMPLTVVTGIYGMNFPIPLYKAQYGYLTVMIAMAAISAGMLIWFRKRKWI